MKCMPEACSKRRGQSYQGCRVHCQVNTEHLEQNAQKEVHRVSRKAGSPKVGMSTSSRAFAVWFFDHPSIVQKDTATDGKVYHEPFLLYHLSAFPPCTALHHLLHKPPRCFSITHRPLFIQYKLLTFSTPKSPQQPSALLSSSDVGISRDLNTLAQPPFRACLHHPILTVMIFLSPLNTPYYSRSPSNGSISLFVRDICLSSVNLLITIALSGA